MSTQTRLDAYLAAEADILNAQEVRGGDRTFRRAELETVRDMIDRLQRQLAREQTADAGQGGLKFSLANLSRE